MSTRHIVEARWVVESDEGLSPDEAGTAVNFFMNDSNRDRGPEIEVSISRYIVKPDDAPDDWKQPKVVASVSMTSFKIEGGLEI